MISAAHKSGTSNLFIIYNFYKQLEKIFYENKICPDQIWTCKETGFSTNLQKCKVVSKKGEIAYKVTCWAKREDITTLAVSNTTGKTLDLFIIFQGKMWHSSWRPKKALLKHIFYGLSESGWMTTVTFALWFLKICDIIMQRSLLLIFDGNLTHVLVFKYGFP